MKVLKVLMVTMGLFVVLLFAGAHGALAQTVQCPGPTPDGTPISCTAPQVCQPTAQMINGNMVNGYACGTSSQTSQTNATTSILLQNPLGQKGCDTLSCPVEDVINFLFTIAIPLFGIMILVGGFQMMMAAGNPEKFSKGKKTLLYSVIGFVIILLAGSVATLIRNIFGGS